MFGVIGWIIFGLIVGIVAKLLMPGRDPGGIIITMALGIAGALLGGFIGRALGWYTENEPAGFLMSLVGCRAAAVDLPDDGRPASENISVPQSGKGRPWRLEEAAEFALCRLVSCAACRTGRVDAHRPVRRPCKRIQLHDRRLPAARMRLGQNPVPATLQFDLAHRSKPSGNYRFVWFLTDTVTTLAWAVD